MAVKGGFASVDISVLGSESLSRALANLPDEVAKKLTRTVLRDSAKRHRSYIVRELLAIRGRTNRSGRERLLQLAEYFENAKIKSAGSKRLIRVGPEFPPRAVVGVDPKDKNYWPSAIEYGSPANNIPAFPYLRPAVDEHKGEELPKVTDDMRKAVHEAWEKIGGKQATDLANERSEARRFARAYARKTGRS